MENKISTRLIAIIILIVVGFNAIFAGIALMLYSDGTIIGLSHEILRFSPFRNFFIPGLFLFLFNGITNITIAILALKKLNITQD